MAAASVVQEIHNVLQVCGISELVTHMRLKDNKGFNSFKDFGVINRDTDVLKMSNFLASRNVATRVNLGAVKIKGFKILCGGSTTGRHTTSCLLRMSLNRTSRGRQ